MATSAKQFLREPRFPIGQNVRSIIYDFGRIAREMGEKPVLLVPHTVADQDAIGTAYSLRALFRGGEVAFQDRPRETTRDILLSLGFDTRHLPMVRNFDPRIPAVLCDHNDPYRSRYVRGSVIAVVDHHHIGSEVRDAGLALVDTNAPAASLIAYEILRINGVHISPDIALALQIGLTGDCGTHHFEGFERVKHLVEWLSAISGKSLKEVLTLAFPPLTTEQSKIIEESLKSAIIFDCQTASRLVRCAITIVGTELFAPIIADALLASSKPLADSEHLAHIELSVVFADGLNGVTETRASIRLGEKLVSIDGFSAAALGQLIGAKFNGKGGGRGNLAGASFSEPTAAVALELSKDLIKEFLACHK